jgi:hypothetical protein
MTLTWRWLPMRFRMKKPMLYSSKDALCDDYFMFFSCLTKKKVFDKKSHLFELWAATDQRFFFWFAHVTKISLLSQRALLVCYNQTTTAAAVSAQVERRNSERKKKEFRTLKRSTVVGNPTFCPKNISTFFDSNVLCTYGNLICVKLTNFRALHNI